jgi:riboflavin transporter FmnP
MEWIRVPTATMLAFYLRLIGKLHFDNDSMGQGGMFLNFHNGGLYVLCLWIYTKPQKKNLVQGIAVESTVMNVLVNLYAYNVYGV